MEFTVRAMAVASSMIQSSPDNLSGNCLSPTMNAVFSPFPDALDTGMTRDIRVNAGQGKLIVSGDYSDESNPYLPRRGAPEFRNHLAQAVLGCSFDGVEEREEGCAHAASCQLLGLKLKADTNTAGSIPEMSSDEIRRTALDTPAIGPLTCGTHARRRRSATSIEDNHIQTGDNDTIRPFSTFGHNQVGATSSDSSECLLDNGDRSDLADFTPSVPSMISRPLLRRSSGGTFFGSGNRAHDRPVTQQKKSSSSATHLEHHRRDSDASVPNPNMFPSIEGGSCSTASRSTSLKRDSVITPPALSSEDLTVAQVEESNISSSSSFGLHNIQRAETESVRKAVWRNVVEVYAAPFRSLDAVLHQSFITPINTNTRGTNSGGQEHEEEAFKERTNGVNANTCCPILKQYHEDNAPDDNATRIHCSLQGKSLTNDNRPVAQECASPDSESDGSDQSDQGGDSNEGEDSEEDSDSDDELTPATMAIRWGKHSFIDKFGNMNLHSLVEQHRGSKYPLDACTWTPSRSRVVDKQQVAKIPVIILTTPNNGSFWLDDPEEYPAQNSFYGPGSEGEEESEEE
ncbi:hypothetical protein QBC34DRAFT_475388 [Podospora aff. communis PSN243]|uniref:Uncharacterized protein n=1 Tax=Podospora aff. communis PSN243 TaxID=3040156 RepID=A0AAV9G6T8_9PEZI|nr:hypothetical protein QBC34DRAFT_475388 [Podospora aff. communis PSN243]